MPYQFMALDSGLWRARPLLSALLCYSDLRLKMSYVLIDTAQNHVMVTQRKCSIDQGHHVS